MIARIRAGASGHIHHYMLRPAESMEDSKSGCANYKRQAVLAWLAEIMTGSQKALIPRDTIRMNR